MRLIDCSTPDSYRLMHFTDANVPPYAILSHVWGQDEVLFEDIQSIPEPSLRPRRGIPKSTSSKERWHSLRLGRRLLHWQDQFDRTFRGEKFDVPILSKFQSLLCVSIRCFRRWSNECRRV